MAVEPGAGGRGTRRPPPSLAAVARAVTWVGAGHLGSLIPWYASLAVLGALLSPGDFGTLATGVAILWIANELMGPGVHGSIVARRLGGDQLWGAMTTTVSRGLLLAAGMAALAGPIVDTFASGGDAGALRLLSVSIVFMAVAVVPMAVLQKRMEFRTQARIRAGASAFASVVAVGSALAGAGVWALVLRQVLADSLIALLAWVAARRFLPPRPPRSSLLRLLRHRSPAAGAFFVFTMTQFIGLSADKLIVGHLTDASRLGLYSLASTLALAPLTQFSWQVGWVLFPAAAATRDPGMVGTRTVKAVRLSALLLLPLVAPAIVLAPILIPDLLGEEWRAMVSPFQILLLAGVGLALVNILGESLSGSGNIDFRARAGVVWCLSSLAAVFVLAHLEGIRGAAVAQLAVIVPLAAAYVVAGARRIGVKPSQLWAGIRSVVVPVAAQAGATVALVAVLRTTDVSAEVEAVVAACLGLVVVVVLLARASPSPLQEGRTVLSAAMGRGPA